MVDSRVREKHRPAPEKNGLIAVRIYSIAIERGLLLQNNPMQLLVSAF
jgi:hypothetical protein